LVSLRVVFPTPSIAMNSGEQAGKRWSSMRWRFSRSQRWLSSASRWQGAAAGKTNTQYTGS
jgi:hypothetical protein